MKIGLIQPRPIVINLQNIRIIQWFLLLNFFHQQQKSNRIHEVEVFPFRRKLVSEVFRHSGRTFDRLLSESNWSGWTVLEERMVKDGSNNRKNRLQFKTMSLENPVSHLKVHGFGAFQQCAEFFLYDSSELLAKNQHPLQEDEQQFLKNMRVMFALFEFTYMHKAELPDALVLEKEAWQLLRTRIGQWIEKFSALLERGNEDLAERKTLMAELKQFMKQWEIISSSFKQKLEAQPVDEKSIRELIDNLRLEIGRVVTEV